MSPAGGQTVREKLARLLQPTGDTWQLVNAARVGAEGVAVVAPWYYSHDQAGLFDHFSAVAKAVADLPVYLYNTPGSVNISPALVAELF